MLGAVTRLRYLLLAILALGVLASAALSAPTKPTLSISRAVVAPGKPVAVVGHGFPPRARVRLVIASRSVARLRAGRRGGFRVRVRVPGGLAAGRYALAARTRGLVVRRRLRVRATSQPSQPAPVPEQPAPEPPAPAPPPPAPEPEPPPPDPITLVAAGDIACRPALVESATACRQARTADLVESLDPDAVAVLGDNQYEHGELANFNAVFDPTWGRFNEIMHPAVGNHEYEGDPERDSAPGYYSYFGDAAGDPTAGYYRWELGGWNVFVLNSGAINYTRAGNPSLPDDCWPVSCAVDSEQEDWLRTELEALPDDACVIAYWHHPRFSSGFGGANQPHPETGPMFTDLYEHGAELLLTGHSQYSGQVDVPAFDATAVARLEAAGAVIVGKTNCDEFAMGSSTENSAFGPTRNPWAPDRIPGGSSGGSAVAVAAGMATIALGSDTGGSIRQPAALCGIVGLKPTYGRVSRYGLLAFGSSLDQIGPLARTVFDAAITLSAMAGPDPSDATSAPDPVPDYAASLTGDVRGARVGVPSGLLDHGVDPEVAQALSAALDTLVARGATLVDVELPNAGAAIPVYYLVATAEASSNLARYDGVRFGFRAKDLNPAEDDLLTMYGRTRAQGFGPEVKRRIMLGTYVLSAGYYDAYYLKAQQVRTLIRRDYEEAFARVDVVAMPTSPTPAFKIGERVDDPLQMYLADVFTVSANLAGLPAVSVPCGFTAGGLPIGLQLTGRMFDEATLLRVAEAYERDTHWSRMEPPL